MRGRKVELHVRKIRDKNSEVEKSVRGQNKKDKTETKGWERKTGHLALFCITICPAAWQNIKKKEKKRRRNETKKQSDEKGAGIAQWLEHQTCDWKVVGLNPCRSGRRIFFSRVNFLSWLLFRYPFHTSVTTVAHKRPQSFCLKCRWQVTAKHAYTWHMWLCMKWHGAWLYGVHRMCQGGSSFTWHQPCQRCKYTTSVDSQKCTIKSYSLMQNHMQPQWVCSRAENSAI